MEEAAGFPETLVLMYQNMLFNFPKDKNIYSHGRENLKSSFKTYLLTTRKFVNNRFSCQGVISGVP
jgi:hypothetical protein